MFSLDLSFESVFSWL